LGKCGPVKIGPLSFCPEFVPMEKYYCYPTQFCNILIIKLEVEPAQLNWNNVLVHKVVSKNLRHNSISRILYNSSIEPHDLFDTYAHAEFYAKKLSADLKDAQIKKIEKEVEHHQKRLDKMKAKVPSIRRIVCG